MPTGPVAVLVNPTAGRGRHRGLLPAVLQALAASGRAVEVVAADTGTAAPTACRAALDAGAGALVAVGGDGTVHLALQAVARTDVPFGIVPAGTGNDIAAHLGLPGTPVAAAEAGAQALRTRARPAGAPGRGPDRRAARRGGRRRVQPGRPAPDPAPGASGRPRRPCAGQLLPGGDRDRRRARHRGVRRRRTHRTAAAHRDSGPECLDAARVLTAYVFGGASVVLDSMVFGPVPADRMSILRGGTTGLVTFFTCTRNSPWSASASTWSAVTPSGSWKVRRNAP